MFGNETFACTSVLEKSIAWFATWLLVSLTVVTFPLKNLQMPCWLSKSITPYLMLPENIYLLVLEVDELIAGRHYMPISGQCLSCRFLKVLTVGELITSAGSRFHSFTKKLGCWSIFVLLLSCISVWTTWDHVRVTLWNCRLAGKRFKHWFVLCPLVSWTFQSDPHVFSVAQVNGCEVASTCTCMTVSSFLVPFLWLVSELLLSMLYPSLSGATKLVHSILGDVSHMSCKLLRSLPYRLPWSAIDWAFVVDCMHCSLGLRSFVTHIPRSFSICMLSSWITLPSSVILYEQQGS